jgi:hypothetical protein
VGFQKSATYAEQQVSLTEDQHAVGEFGSQGAHEPFGETVRPGLSG